MQKYDFRVRAGNSGTTGNGAGLVIIVSEGDPPALVNLTGQTVVFRAMSKSGVQVVRKDMSTGIVVDIALAKITVPITVAESRLMATNGPDLTYDLERRNGAEQRTLLFGSITVDGSSNDD